MTEREATFDIRTLAVGTTALKCFRHPPENARVGASPCVQVNKTRYTAHSLCLDEIECCVRRVSPSNQLTNFPLATTAFRKWR
jgi:hypothetical protein